MSPDTGVVDETGVLAGDQTAPSRACLDQRDRPAARDDLLHLFCLPGGGRRTTMGDMVEVSSLLERFWPSRRGHAFDELCR